MVLSKAAPREKNGLLTPPNDTSPPPAYAHGDFNPVVPDITAAFSNLNLAPSPKTPKPTPDLCIAHLKLLEAFHQLREDVACEDGLFGIKDAFADAVESDRERTELLIKIREKRWQIYVTKAARRFKGWWITCVEPSDERNRLLGQSQIPSVFSQSPDVGERLVWREDHLPPLGKYNGESLPMYIDECGNRCHHGLACIHAESTRFSRRLPPSRKDEILESWLTLGGHRSLHRQQHLRVQRK